MKTEKFNYDLPEHLIAQYPSIQRADSKLLVALESIQHEVFKDIENYLDKGDLLILNKTSVIPARLFGEKITGGKIELLLERFLSNHQTLTQIRSRQPSLSASIGTPLNKVSLFPLKNTGRFGKVEFGKDRKLPTPSLIATCAP